MNDDDYKLTPTGGRVTVTGHGYLGEFATMEDALEFVSNDMEAAQYWPSIYWISDYLNVSPIDLDGNILSISDDDKGNQP